MHTFGKVLVVVISVLCVTSVVAGADRFLDVIPLRLHVANTPKIVGIRETRDVLFAIIDAGLNSKFRSGVQCTTEKENDRLVVVDASLDKCVALVLNGTRPKYGDRVHIIPAN